VIVIADTSPLNYLVRLGRPEILADLFGRVIIPGAVLAELSHPEAPTEVRAFAFSPPPWIEVVRAETIDATLPDTLGAGEREAISLALALRADILLIDERARRDAATARDVGVAGAVAVLLQAALSGWLDLRDAIGRRRGMGFRLSDDVERAALARLEEANRSAN